MTITHRIQLPDLMRHLNLPMIAAELGVSEGYHSADLLRNGIEKLYSIDAWEKQFNVTGDASFSSEWHTKNFNAAMNRLSVFKEKVIVLRGLTNEMSQFIPDDSLGLCYIDANHDYPFVKEDILNYYPKLVIGGIMAFHDFITYEGVNKAVNEFATNNNLVIHDLPENKIEDAGCYILKK